MKDLILIIAAVWAECVVHAAELPVEIKIDKDFETERYSFSRNISFANGHNRYLLVFVQNRASENKAPHSLMLLHGPTVYGSFSRPVDFARLTVNDIPVSVLDPKDEDIRVWKEDHCGGVDIKLNFDGARVILRLYMREDSPVLFGSVRKAEDSVTPFRSAVLLFEAVPSGLVYNKKRAVVWQGEDFAREAVTAARTIRASASPVPLLPEDRYFILQDAKNDGVIRPGQKDDRENTGPCFLTCDLTKGIESATLAIHTSSTAVFEFRLRPDQGEFRFGVWQHKNRHTNQEFRQQFEQNKKSFLLP